jgi:hypothetical protein
MVNFEDLTKHVKGDTVEIETTITQNGTAFDVSGANSMLLTVKRNLKQDDSEAFIQVNGSFVTDGTDGKLVFVLEPNDTSEARVGIDYYYDIQIKLTGDQTYTVNKGKMVFLDEVTTT